MATWGLHIRIAEQLLQIYDNLDCKSFLVGNIAPDCGKPNKSWSEFNPPNIVTHWKDENDNINAHSFCLKYLSLFRNNLEYSFLLGYYSHLLADIEWVAFFEKLKDANEQYKQLQSDKTFIWTIKKDWYDLDHLYFKNNPESLFWTTFQHIRDFPDYLNYYPGGAIVDQIRYISNFYNKPPDNLDREYKYLSMENMDTFLKSTVQTIADKIRVVDTKISRN